MRILLLEKSHAAYTAVLRKTVPELEFVAGDEPAVMAEAARGCPIWFGQPDQLAYLLSKGITPRWLHSTWAGIRPLLCDKLPSDYVLTRAVGVFGQLMAEYVLTHLLAHERQVASRMYAQAERRWDARVPGSLAGRNILIVGAGDIGRDVAHYLLPFGVSVRGIARAPRAIPGFEQVLGLSELSVEVGEADYIISLLPDTPATANLYTQALFARMKPSAVFINAGRGTAVVDADLVAALEAGQLAGAVLDVFREEPLPCDHPFWTAPRLTITSHTAAVDALYPTVRLFLGNLKRFQQGEPLRGQVDFTKGY
ncbi:phosphoglycerate dehydrogenase-like enzyme [Pseudomonas duriflava]|uniref:Phosphoglycerate dehydrogenase-like enzyme n=1 Tax=Pseudomonas duriflava TaxID=459528 RepID=A0A562QAJ1_9PSED|nr:D-2-hydroxyacid dehydrogenase [Pseudomonas duriflava]TWI53743.1 phosphoglycerate dehydrogenase-like enzyme [Pseudomonas duriflava]